MIAPAAPPVATVTPAAILHIPPHDLEAESAVLGAMLLDAEAIPRAVEILDAEHFYAGPNARLFAIVRGIFDAGKIPDPITVRSEIDRRGALPDVGGVEAIAGHLDRVESAANLEHWATIVRDHAVRRRVLAASGDLLAAARRGDAPEQLAEIAQRALGETEFAVASRSTFAGVLDEVFAQIDAPAARRGVPTTYHALDEILGGFRPGSLNLLGARPSMGKTTLAINIATHVATMGVPVAFLSLEMPERDLVRKSVALLAGVAEKRLGGGYILTTDEREKIQGAEIALRSAPMFVEYGEFSTTSLRAKIRQLKIRHGVELVIVDYLGLIRAPGDVRTIRSTLDLVTHVSASLKSTAVSTNVPILALCQLSRANARENEGAKKAEDVRPPSLTDLRDSGSLEQDADSVMFLHRDGYYTKDVTDTSARVIVAKNRCGETGDAGLVWVPWCQRFVAPGFST